MERLPELLARLSQRDELPAEELDAIETDLQAVVEELRAEPVSAEIVEALGQITDAITGIREVRAARAEELATLEAEAAQLLSVIEGDPTVDEDEADEADAETDEAPEAETDEAPVADAEQIAAADEEPAPEAVAAAAARRRARGTVPLARVREHQPASARTVSQTAGNGRPAPRMLAAPDLRNFHSGEAFSTWDEAFQATTDLLEDTRGAHSGSPIKRRVATLDWRDQYPADRYLTASADSEQNSRMIRDLLMADGNVPTAESLVATGGLCAPLEVRYDVVDLATAERPLRGALPAMRADRGGLRWMPTTVLADVIVDTTSGAIDTVTAAQDLAGSETKTVQEFTCPTEQTATVTAVSERLQFGNFADRYWPENVRSQMNTARASHSRRVERGLFETMRAGSVLINTNTGLNTVGAFPNFVGTMRAAARHYRYQFRLSEDQALRVVLPTWFLDVLATDLYYQAPGDGIINSRVNVAQLLQQQLGDFNVSISYQRDDARTNDANGAGAPAFTTQAAGSLADYPGRVSALLFHEGAWLFLDGGTLDFGIVRDSTLNGTNKWQTFFEVFETAAMVGLASWNLTFQNCANGSRAALASVDCGPIGS